MNLIVKQCRKSAIMAKQTQMANKADSSAHGKANPCGHPACRFVGKTAEHIDARLTLPKLHLATFNVTFILQDLQKLCACFPAILAFHFLAIFYLSLH